MPSQPQASRRRARMRTRQAPPHTVRPVRRPPHPPRKNTRPPFRRLERNRAMGCVREASPRAVVGVRRSKGGAARSYRSASLWARVTTGAAYDSASSKSSKARARARSPASIATFAAVRMASSVLVCVEAETSRRFASSCVAAAGRGRRRGRAPRHTGCSQFVERHRLASRIVHR